MDKASIFSIRPKVGTFARITDILLCYIISTAIVFGGLLFGNSEISSHPVNFFDIFSKIDGSEYQTISEHGYSYKSNVPSNVAFFPAYPLMANAGSAVFRVRPIVSLVIVSNMFFLFSILLFSVYLRTRNNGPVCPVAYPIGESNTSGPLERTHLFSILAMCLLPTTFYCHLAYSESFFLFMTILTLALISWRTPSFIIAMIVGLGTAARPVGVSLILPFIWYLIQTSPSRRRLFISIVVYIPLSTWGIVSYMAYQYYRFHTPFAFAATQELYRFHPTIPWNDRLLALAAWEPIRNIYDMTSSGSWEMLDKTRSPLFNLCFANPLYFVATIVLIVLGSFRRWLNAYEILLSVPLIIIPYVTRGYEMEMQSQARFMVVVLPAYICLGRLLVRASPLTGTMLLCVSSFQLGIYSALYAGGRKLY